MIYGPCQRILTYPSTDNYIRKYASIIQQNAQKLNALILELIEFRRLETGNKTLEIQKLPVSAQTQNTADSFNELAESRKINYQLKIEKEVYWNSDAGCFSKIINNLLSNAFKYTPENGMISIEQYVENEQLHIRISNTGKGIEKENLTKIFDRYKILDNFEIQNKNGISPRNGMGLAICHSMVTLLNGQIRVTSTPNQLTTFEVILPALSITATDTERPMSMEMETVIQEGNETMELESPTPAYDTSRQTIIVIDDDPSMLWFVSDIFANKYNVFSFNDTEKAMEQLKLRPVDLIISDIMMPGTDGISFAKQIKSDKLLTHTPLILLSALNSIKQSFVKLNPRVMIKNPIMFTVEVCTAIMFLVMLYSIVNDSQGSFIYNLWVFVILFITLLFANFAEAIAEARGKAQADSLRKTREETPAKLIVNGTLKTVSSSRLKKGDIFVCEAGDVIPADGEIIEGLASIDESAITGESAPVIREAGGDKSSVTGGTKVLSDQIKVMVSTQPGESFLDKMIALVEGASRQKTPNEIALTILLAAFTLVFVIVCITLKPFADYTGTVITIASFLSLFVCLIPTTIGGLLSAIGIAGMDRALRANVITKSGKAVETAGDIDTLLLDKTGTITIGNRKATRFYPAQGVDEHAFIEACLLSSVSDDTPEGKSIIELGRESGLRMRNLNTDGAHMIKFTAETKCSGINLKDGTEIRKGAFDAIRKIALSAGNPFPKETEDIIQTITSNGGTPLVVSVNKKIAGVIELQDIIKPGIQERFERLRKMGVKTVMVTGDNPLTAKYIAEKAGVDDFIAEAKPEDKMEYIKKEQAAGKLVAMMGDGTNDAPALAQANVGVAMNSGTQAAKEAGNMVDLDNDPTKLIEIVEIGKQLLMTRGTLTTFSIANDVAKYFAIVPALFMLSIPELAALNIMGLHSPESAILSAVIFNAIIIPILIPLALKGVQYKPIGASALLRRNLLIYGIGGVIAPFVGIKLIDLVVGLFF